MRDNPGMNKTTKIEKLTPLDIIMKLIKFKERDSLQMKTKTIQMEYIRNSVLEFGIYKCV